MAGALWLFLAALGAAAAEEPIDGWLPEGTLFCLSVESPPRTAERLAGGRYGALRGDPAAQRLKLEARALLAQAREASLERGEVWLGSFWELARGPILLAVVRARGREAPVVVMDVGDRDAFQDHLARLAGAGVLGPEAVLEYRGHPVRSRAGGEGAGEVFWTGRAGVVAFSWRASGVEAVIDQLCDGGRGLAPRLDEVRAKLREDADVLLYLPPAAVAELEQRNSDPKELALGEDTSVGLSITLDPDALDVRAFVFARRPRTGVLAFLDEPNGALDPPPFLAEEARAIYVARFDLARLLETAGVKGDEAPPLAKRFVRALGNRFALAQVERDQVFLAEVESEAWMRRLLSTLPGTGDGVHEGPDGAVAMRDGWLIAAERARPVLLLLAARSTERHASATLPEERIMFWRLAPGAPRDWDDPTRLLAGQEGALVNDPDGLLLVHRAFLR